LNLQIRRKRSTLFSVVAKPAVTVGLRLADRNTAGRIGGGAPYTVLLFGLAGRNDLLDLIRSERRVRD
jgi:hypothetical protein